MKLIKQFGVILLISFLGEVLRGILPLPVPASIYGLVLLFVALETHLLPLEKVKDVGKFLIEIMPLMFIPAGVGLLDSWGALEAVFVPVAAITIISTIVVMGVSGRVTQAVIRKEKRNEHEDHTN